MTSAARWPASQCIQGLSAGQAGMDARAGRGTAFTVLKRARSLRHVVLGRSACNPFRGAGFPVVQSIEDEFYAAGDAELFEDAEQIFLDRMLAQVEFARDEAIAEAFGDESDHLLFAGREKTGAAVIQDSQRRHFGNHLHEVIELLGIGPDLSGGNTHDALAELPQVGFSDLQDAARS